MAFFKSLNFNNKNLKAKKNTFKNIILNEKIVFIFTINIFRFRRDDETCISHNSDGSKVDIVS